MNSKPKFLFLVLLLSSLCAVTYILLDIHVPESVFYLVKICCSVKIHLHFIQIKFFSIFSNHAFIHQTAYFK